MLTPCTPSPCGPNTVCKDQNGVGSCSCVPDYIGDPYEGCRPECTVDSNCMSNMACIRSKCQNPCPGTCGQDAQCQVVNHLPRCSCIPGFTGDPYRICIPPPPTRKSLINYTKARALLILNDNEQKNTHNKNCHQPYM